MASWATKRRWSYISIISIVIIVLIVIPGFFTFYKAPTCFDGIPNQGEQGVDCGGPCQVLCQTAFIPAKVIWADSEMVAPGTYNEAAYIENPNINGAAVDVPYTFSMFDEQGVLISNNSGTVTIPANRNTLAFVGSVKTGTRVPAKNGVTFKFNTPPKWVKAYDTLGDIVIKTPTFHANSDPALGDVGTTLQALRTYQALPVISGGHHEKARAALSHRVPRHSLRPRAPKRVPQPFNCTTNPLISLGRFGRAGGI